MYIRGCHKIGDSKTIGQLKFICHSGLRRRHWAWDFKGKAGDLQVGEKEQAGDKQILVWATQK